MNRPAARWLGLAGLPRLLLFVAGPHLPSWGAGVTPGDTGVLLVLATILLTYPLPLRRGSQVLYDPEAVRALAESRGRTLALTLGFVLALPWLLFPGHPTPFPATFTPSWAVAAVAVGAGLVGLTLTRLRGTPLQRGRWVVVPLAILVVGPVLLELANRAGPTGWWAILPWGAAGLVGLFGPAVLGARLREGKTIVSRRG